ncbi:hypothetical protein CL6EHI_c00004 [Entamoeba histolytica]|uniref:Uncharacterized protein n=1 Tax=Entamoeba histolytica TaxID=5759 RepID=A0A175JCQ3_ENTHI|nr:hypothetical protein CL6EHI_c00004 [Entamoeba histolytica]
MLVNLNVQLLLYSLYRQAIRSDYKFVEVYLCIVQLIYKSYN